jgi:hypothetical protein
MVPGLSVICNQLRRLVTGGDSIIFSNPEELQIRNDAIFSDCSVSKRKTREGFDYNNNNTNKNYIIQLLYVYAYEQRVGRNRQALNVYITQARL